MIVANPNQSNTRWLRVCVLLCALVALPLGLSCQRGYTVTDAEKLAGEGGVHDEEIQTPTAPMVLIPAGEFTMGTTSEQEQWLRDKGWWHDWMAIEQPTATVYLDAYYIDKYEVTNAQYGEFMKATGRSAPLYWNDSRYNEPNQPVVGVTYDDAEAYCEWAEKRLPTEAEWEKAARGTGWQAFPLGERSTDL